MREDVGSALADAVVDAEGTRLTGTRNLEPVVVVVRILGRWLRRAGAHWLNIFHSDEVDHREVHPSAI